MGYGVYCGSRLTTHVNPVKFLCDNYNCDVIVVGDAGLVHCGVCEVCVYDNYFNQY